MRKISRRMGKRKLRRDLNGRPVPSSTRSAANTQDSPRRPAMCGTSLNFQWPRDRALSIPTPGEAVSL